MHSLQDMLTAHHQYVPIYQHAYKILWNYDEDNDVNVRLHLNPGLDCCRYNLPTADKVVVILPGTSPTEPHDIILQNHGPLYCISDLHPAYVPLQYPLLFPHGENGWHAEMTLHEMEEQQNTWLQNHQQQCQHRQDCSMQVDDSNDTSSRHLTLSHYVAYHIHYCPQEFNALLCGGHLFTCYVVNMFASVDPQRLHWIEMNQPLFRAAHFEDAAVDDPDNFDLNEIGQRVFLPLLYIRGPRNLGQCYQDSMAIACYFQKVDIFLTMTTNPQWEEIERELLPGQTAYNCPDLVAQVFKMKKNTVLDYIYKHGVFGAAITYIYMIEFQKCGLPHMHCLIFL